MTEILTKYYLHANVHNLQTFSRSCIFIIWSVVSTFTYKLSIFSLFTNKTIFCCYNRCLRLAMHSLWFFWCASCVNEPLMHSTKSMIRLTDSNGTCFRSKYKKSYRRLWLSLRKLLDKNALGVCWIYEKHSKKYDKFN